MEYIQARESQSQCTGSAAIACIIDKKPYFPLLAADASDEASILLVASTILGDDTIQTYSTVTKLQGGLTNTLFKVGSTTTTTNGGTHASYLVRLFGAPGLIDRDLETTIFAALAEQGIAPKYYGRFQNGRVEQFLEHMTTLTNEELPLYAKSIAESMAHMHTKFCVPPPQLLLQTSTTTSSTTTPTPLLWTQLQDWMKQVMTFQQLAHVDHFDDIPHQLLWLQQHVVPPDAAVAFCHNDLLAANILVDTSNNVQLIDFEYGSINYIAYDIANHWNEYAGGTDTATPNYNLLPNKKQKEDFIKAYLGATGDSTIQPEVLYAHVQAFTLVNHLYWGLWAMIQGATCACQEFDYLLYATHRINQYYVEREKYIKDIAVNESFTVTASTSSPRPPP